MPTPSPSRALLAGAVAATVALGSVALVAPGASAAAKKKSSITKTASFVPGYCSSPSGFVTNGNGTVRTLRMTVSPSSPRAGAKMKVKVFVRQSQSTLAGAFYPRGTLRGQVVVKAGAKTHVLTGPTNKRRFTGPIFPEGWTAKATFKAPAKGKRAVTVQRIVYNARGAYAGGWDSDYAGFDLVCSGGQNPITMATAYANPRITIKVRKKAA